MAPPGIPLIGQAAEMSTFLSFHTHSGCSGAQSANKPTRLDLAPFSVDLPGGLAPNRGGVEHDR